MACPCELLTDAPDQPLAQRLLDAASTLAWRIEHKFSRYRGDNVVQQILDLPEGNARFAEEIGLLGKVSSVMLDARDGWNYLAVPLMAKD